MSDFLTIEAKDFKQLISVVDELKESVAFLTSQLGKKHKRLLKSDDAWLDEKTAAYELGCTERYLRKNAKTNVWSISYRNVSGRRWEYKAIDIQNFLKSSVK